MKVWVWGLLLHTWWEVAAIYTKCKPMNCTQELLWCRYKGNRLAVKAAAVGSPEESSLRHEASMYQKAASLQGVLLPNVVLSGLAFNGKAFVLETELLRGPQMDAALHQHLEQDALDAIAGLHAVGMAHRDIRAENILVVENSIRLLDLHLAKSSDEKRLRREDVRSMTSLFA